MAAGVVTLAIGILGNITAVLLFLSPMPTFWDIIKKRSIGSYSSIPYISSLFNCLLWTFYGLPMITSNNVLVVTINGFGTALESIYTIIFLTFAKGKAKIQTMGMALAVVVLFIIVVVVTLTVVPQDQRALVVGSLALILNTAMYAAPLSVMSVVIRTKSVESMPFLLSLFTLINSCLWAAYGIYQLDKFIIIPNALGIIFGVLQIVLYAMYYKHDSKRSEEISTTSSATEDD